MKSAQIDQSIIKCCSISPPPPTSALYWSGLRCSACSLTGSRALSPLRLRLGKAPRTATPARSYCRAARFGCSTPSWTTSRAAPSWHAPSPSTSQVSDGDGDGDEDTATVTFCVTEVRVWWTVNRRDDVDGDMPFIPSTLAACCTTSRRYWSFLYDYC